MNHSVIIPIPRKLDHNLWRLHLRKIIVAAGVALVSLIGGVGVALAANNGQLVGSGTISGEPLVGGSITFDISVINDPPGVGVFYQDRLYNLTGVVVLPPELTLNSCTVTPSSVLQDTPAAGYTEIRFDNIKNLEVNESVGLSCSATLNPIVDIDDTFTINYRWEAYTNPCESCTGEWRYFPFAPISATPQAIDIEKGSSTTTGEAQVNGADAYEPAPAPGHGAGPDWPYTYTLTLTNNPLNPVNQVSVFDIIPPGVAYLGNDTVICSVLGAPAGSTPARTLSDGSLPNTVDGSIVLEWNLETLFGPGTVLSPGETCTFSYQTAIPYRERRFADSLIVGGGPFSGPIVGGPDASHQNNYYATGDYEHPLNGDMPQIDGSIPGATPGDDAPVSVHSSYHSITKGSSTSTVYQDTTVTYTVTGYISEYYDFTASAGTPYVITDLIPDGLEFCSTIAPGDTNGFYDECSFVATPALFNGAPLDPVSVALSGDDLLITWHVTDPSAVQAGDTWTLTYRAIVRDFYRNGLPVSGLDVRPNSVEVEGEWNDLVSPPRTGTDTTGATTSIEVGQPMIDKRIWDPSTGTWVQGPVTLEIGQDLSYRIQLTFDEDLDMRNVIVDDFLPMAQRYIPSSALFDGSQGYGDTVPPFTPQAAQGQYSGTTYQVEAAQDLGNFHIDFCPYNDTLSRVDGNPSDPFLTVFENMVGGRQRLEWFLCRIDNSDTGTNIIWQVDFDGVVVDDTQVYNGCQVNNFGQLSGTNSFGTTYSLRDSLASVYAVPNLVMRKTNTAPDPLLAPGAFSYTLSVENDGGVSGAGNAYDWTIRDIIPPGLRVPTTAGSCNGFGTTAPGSYDCIADAGAQAGTGGFVTIRPIDGLGSHDPTRPIPPATTYDFTFQAEMTDVTPGATADEELFNTASVEYCTRPMPQDLDNDGSTDRRCEGYLADTIFHSDEGGTPTYPDFRDYTDVDDAAPNGPNEEDNTDTSRVHIVALATNKSHVAPVHISPQVAGDFATIGEVYQVSLEIGIPARTVLFNDPTAGYAEVIDTFAHEGAVFCDAGDGIAGCVDPAITQPGALATPDTVQSPAAPDWWQENNTSPSPGSTARFFLETIDNSAGLSAYTFTITFTMVVTGQNDTGNAVFFLPAANDIVSNSFIVRYFNDNPTPEEFTTTPAGDQIDIDQPHISANKEAVSITRPGVGVLCNSAAACNSIQVQGNDTIAYQMTYTSDGESTAFDVSMIDWLTVYATYNSDMVCTSDTAPPVGGGVVSSSPAPAPYTTELLIDTTPAGRWNLPPGNRVTCTYTITVEPTVPAGTTLGNFTDADWSTLDGATIPDERVFDDSPNDGTQDEDTEILQVIVPVAGKTRLAPGPTGPGTQPPVRIGDVVDYRITIPLPIGRTQDIVISDYLDPGLIYYEGGTLTIRTNTLNPLTYTQTLNGSNDGIGAFSVDWAVWDPACIPVVGATNCIYNDGTNNTVVTVDFQAIVADVPLNLDGLVLDNDMQATFRDGLGNSGTITHGGAQDDEEVEIVEPHLSLTKSAAPATVDAGDLLTYTVAISNDGMATAYDVSFDENLDDRTDYDTSYTMQCVHSVSGLLASEIDLTPFDGMPDAAATSMDTFRVAGDLTENSNGWDVAPGASITCTYRVTVLDTVVPGYTIDNIADADWSSLDGQVAGGPTEPNEREYDDSGSDATGFPAHTESDDQDTSTATVPVPTLVKDRTSGATVQPGQLVTYQIVVTVPESTISSLSITDTLPLPANAFRYESFGSATSGWGGALPAFSVQPAAGASGTLTWTFAGPITNPGDNNAANNTITLAYTIRVYSNATGGNNTNTAQASYTNEAGGTSTTNTDTAVVNVIRPVNTTTKTASLATADAGDSITYTVTIQNSGPAGTVAYDVYFDENLNDYTDYVMPSTLACTHSASGPLTFEVDISPFDGNPDSPSGTMDVFRVAGDLTENDNPWMLASGQTITCTYQVIVLDSVQPGGTLANAIQNTITATFDSADSNQTGEQGFSSPVSRTVTVPAPTFTSKTRTSPVVGVDDVVQPGELVSYRIVLTLPEGTTGSLQIQDVLPAGFAFVSTDSVTAGWGGALPAFSAQPAAGATGTLTWTFGAGVVNTGDNVANNTLTLNYTVRVTAAAVSTTTPLNNGNDAVNTGSASYIPPGGVRTSIGSGTARVDVLRPANTTTKTASVATADAGNTITYTVTITNNGPAGSVAYDVYFNEDLSNYTDYDTSYTMTCVRNPGAVALTYEVDDLSDGFDTTPDAFAAALDQFRIAGDLTENDNPWMLASGQTITCTYQVIVLDSVQPGGTLANAIQNTITSSFDSADGDQTGEQDFALTVSRTVTVNAPVFTSKTRTSPVVGVDDVVQPGELVSYRIVLTLPEGTTSGLRIQDALPVGFAFVSTDSVSSGWGGALPAFSAQPAAGATGTLTWSFGAGVVNPGDNLANNTITLNYTVRVTAAAASTTTPLNNGNDAVNTGSASYDAPPAGGALNNIGSGTARVDVLRPAITVDKTVVPAGGDAGDSLDYSVTITNSGSGVAYDVYFEENLSDYTDYDTAYTMTCVRNPGTVALTYEMDDLSDGFDETPDAFAAALDRFRIAGDLTENSNPWMLDPGQSITCTYRVTIRDDARAGSSGANALTNSVTGTFDSADGDQPQEQSFNPTDTTSVSVPAPSFTKNRTSLPDAVQPGELVTYNVVITLPEGTTNGLIVADALPAGFEFVSLDAVTAGWGGALPGFASQPAAGATGILIWTFNAGVVNPGDNIANNTLTLAYTVRVTATATSTTLPLGNGNNAVNTAQVFYTPPGGGSTSVGTDTAAVDVIRPTLAVTKGVAPALPNRVDAGDLLDYSVTITNSGPGTAYDVYLDENLDDATGYVIPSTLVCTHSVSGALTFEIDISPFDGSPDTAVPTMDVFRIVGDLTENDNPWALAPGQSITCTYRIVLDQNVPASDSIANAVTGYGDTVDGDAPGEDTLSDGETSLVQTPDASITKNNDASAAEYHATDAYAPGELAPYEIVVSVPEGSIRDLVVCDNLPPQMSYESTTGIANSDGVTYTGVDYTILTAGFPAACPAGTDVAYQFASPLVLDDVPNADNTTAGGDFKTITIRSLARVLGTAIDGQALTNTATLAYTRGDTGATQTDTDDETINAVVVSQSTDKAITGISRGGAPLCADEATCNTVEVNPGDVLSYMLTLTNTHTTATAYEVTMSDDLPLHLRYDGNLACERVPGGPLATTPPAAGSDPILVDAAAIGTVNLAPAEALHCTYTATVQASVPAGASLTNTVAGRVTTAPGGQLGEVTITDTGSDTATSASIDLELVKTVDDGTPYVGEYITFRLTLTNRGTSGATGVVVEDILPAGYAFDSASPAGVYDNATGLWTVGALAAGGSTQLDLTVRVNPAGPYDNYAQVDDADQSDTDSTPGDDSTTQDDDDTLVIDILPTVEVTKTADRVTLPEAGGPVTFTIEVHNTSPETVTLTVLTDSVFGNLNGQGSCATGGGIAAGATYTCTFTRTITDPPRSTHENTVTATVQDAQSNTATDTDIETVTVDDIKPSIIIQKTASVTTLNEPGGNVTFTVEVTNNSDEDNVLTVLTDDIFGNLNGVGTCATGGTIAARTTYTCSFTEPITGTVHVNEITGTLADDDENSDTKKDDATVTILDVVQVTKAAGSPTVGEPGAPVTFTVQVRNTSLGPVTLTTLTDDVFGDLNGAGDCVTGGTISSGAAYSCTFTRTISGNADFVHNDTITATVTDGGGNPATDTASATVTVTNVTPNISVTKTPLSGSLNEPGGVVRFTVAVNNNSFEQVWLDTLDDSVFGDLTLIPGSTCILPQTIAPTGDYSCAFDGAVTGDVDPVLWHTNTVTATLHDDDGSTVTPEGTATVEFTDAFPDIDVTKSANPTTVSEPGEDVEFTVTVHNNSPEQVTLMALDDSVFDDLTVIPGSTCATGVDIAAGGIYSCTFTRFVGGEGDTQHHNTVNVTVQDNEGNTETNGNDATVDILDVTPQVTVTKTADAITLTEPGGDVTYTVLVENDSVESVTLTSLSDNRFGDLTTIPGATCATGGVIPVDGSYSCTFTRTITGDTTNPHTNTVTGVVVDNEGNPASDTGVATVGFGDFTGITIDVTKSANPTTVSEPGEDVEFTVTVRNSSPEQVTLMELDDTVFNDLTTIPGSTCATGVDIAAGGIYSCTFTQFVGGEGDTQHHNTVNVTVQDNEGNTETNGNDATVDILDVPPQVTVTKTAGVATIDEPGGSVTYTVLVENGSSAEQARLTSLVDDMFGNLNGQGSCVVPQVLAPQGDPSNLDEYTCTFSGSVTGAVGSTHTNTVVATVEDNDNNSDDDNDTADVTIQDVPPTIAVSKTPNRGSLPEPGGAVSFTVEVRNTSLVEALTLTALVDDVFGDLNGQGDCLVPQSIPVSGSYSCTFSGAVTGDVNASHINEVTATARDDDGGSVSPFTTAEVTFTDEMPAIVVTKTAGVVSINEPGGNVTYTVEVRNNPVEPVTLNSLVDDVFGDLNGQGTCVTGGAIAAGGTYTCTFVGNVTGTVGSIHTNEVTGTATDNEGNTASYSGTADVLIADVIDVTKSPDSGSLPEPGGDVRFTVVVTNLTGTEITLDALVDDVFGDLDGVGTCDMPRTIAAGGNYACQFIPPITGNAGDTHTDTVTASVTDSAGNPASDTDSATVDITDVTPFIVVTKTANPSTVNEPGGDVTFTVDVENRSPEPVELTVLTDDVFGDLSGQGSCAVPQTIPARATYSCAFTRPINDSAGAIHRNEVTAGVRDDELHFITDTDDAVVTVNPTVDLELDKTVDDAAPNLGDTITFTLTLTNHGPSAATGVEVEDVLPSGYAFDSATPSQGAYDDATGLWAVGALTSGQTVTLDISMVVGPPGTYDNYAQVSATNEFDSDSTPGDDSTDEDDDAAVAVVPILGCISGALYLDTNRNGIQDTGEAPLANVRLRLYDGATLLGEVVTDAAGAYTFPNLPPGTYSVEIDQATLPAGVPIFLTPGNPRQDIVVTVGGTCAVGDFALVIVDPAITKSGSPSQASPGDTVVFSIQVTNTSTTTAMSSVVVRDPLNGYFVFVSATTSQGSYTYDAVTHVVAFDLGTLNAGATATMTITVRISASVPRPASINNQASVSYQNGNPLSSQVVTSSVPSLPGATVTPVPTTTAAPTTTVTATPTATTTGTGSGGSSGDGPTILPETGSRPADGWSILPILILAVLLAVVGIVLCARLMRGQSRSQLVVLGAMMLLLIGMVGGAGALLITALPATQLEVSRSEAAPGNPSSALAGDNPTPLPATRDETVGTAGAIDKQTESTATSTDLVAPMKLATRLLIPAIEVDAPIVRASVAGKTWDISKIYDEVAYLEDTAYPGGPGNAVLAGHVTHLRGDGPFLLLNRLAAGDIIVAEGDGAAYVYRVVWVKVTEKDDIEVTYPTASPSLTLITCVQWDRASNSYKKRLAVRAELIEQHEVRAVITAPTNYSQ